MILFVTLCTILFVCCFYDNIYHKSNWTYNNPYSRTCKHCGRTYNQYQDVFEDARSYPYWEEIVCTHKNIDCKCQQTVENRVDWVTWVMSIMR